MRPKRQHWDGAGTTSRIEGTGRVIVVTRPKGRSLKPIAEPRYAELGIHSRQSAFELVERILLGVGRSRCLVLGGDLGTEASSLTDRRLPAPSSSPWPDRSTPELVLSYWLRDGGPIELATSQVESVTSWTYRASDVFC